MTTYRSKLATLAITACLVALAGCTSHRWPPSGSDGRPRRAGDAVEPAAPADGPTTRHDRPRRVGETPPADGAPAAQIRAAAAR